MKILLTGTAGFIGYHLAKQLMERGDEVVGLDIINDYYDVRLKYARLKETGIETDKIHYNKIIHSQKYPNYRFIQLDLADNKNLFHLFEKEKFDKVCHLAAQPGVRYSLINPGAYIQANIIGHHNLLEALRHYGQPPFVYASSSSVYGINKKQPFSINDRVDYPVSLYAATKKADELFSHTYSYLFKIPTVGLRFFTVYGPWGRPDMALFKFVKNIFEGKPIDVYNNGQMERDFTYIDDIIEGVIKTIDGVEKVAVPGNNPETPAPYKIYNIGRGKPVPLMDFIRTIERLTGKKALINYLPMQPGDVPSTYADTSELEKDFNYRPKTDLAEGIAAFIEWYKKFYKV